jgi:hypothetical protein
MASLALDVSIACPPQRVFTTVAHLGEFARAVPSIARADCLTEIEEGEGAQWEVFRQIGGLERSTVFEIVEYEPATWVRIISDAGGATWDAGFEITPDGKTSILGLTLEAKARSMKTRLGLPLIMTAAQTAFAKDLDAVKRHCEAG